MGKLKRTVSAVMAVMIALNIFAGLAAAATVVEPPDVSNTKSGARSITCANYGYAVDYQADISPSTDVDWYTCNVNSGEKIAQFMLTTDYLNNMAMYAEDSDGHFVERVSYMYGGAGTGIVQHPAVYSKIKNDAGNTYSGYRFYIQRNVP